MADADAEAAFLSSMQAMNEGTGEYNNDGGASGQQIDSPSSDEYDPAPDVQDVSLSSGPPYQSQLQQDSHADPSNNAPSRTVSASAQPSPVTVNGVTAKATPANNLSLGDANGIVEQKPVRQLDPQDASVPAVPSAAPTSLASTTSSAEAGATTHENKTVVPEPSAKDEKAMESSSTAISSKARLPHDKIGLLEDRIKEDERGDMDAWLSLISEHRKRGKLDDARRVYEKFFSVFPSAAEQWVAYTQLENEAQNRAGVELIFNKTLTKLPSLQLWSAYLDHIRRHYNVAADKTASQVIHAAYEAVINAVGIDKDAGKIWQDYIQFIKSGPGILGGSNWQDQQKMDLLRKVYQRAICIPTQAVESLWREYNGFEMSLNKLTGRKFLQDQSPAYMTARSSHVELQGISRDLKRTTLPSLPPALGFDGDVEYMKQVEIWKRWIQWEKDDPLVLKEENLSAYRGRIIYVYEQALMALRFWPEMWYDAADFCFNNDLETQGNDFLARGITANPESCLLAFKHADRLELSTTNGNDDESKKRQGDTVREPYDTVLGSLYDLVSKALGREARDMARIEAHFDQSTENTATRPPDIDRQNEEEEDPTIDSELQQRKKIQIDMVKALSHVQVRLLNKTISHAWIALMRAMRRIQGKGKVGAVVGGSRQVFTDARKRGRITSDVWIAAAMDEFHSGESEAAKRIFDRGVKMFAEDENFALEYIKHLINTNDHTNARSAFETTVTKLFQKPETVLKAKPLYAFFHDFQARYGELAEVVKLEKRMSEAFPDDPRLSSFSQRFTHDGFDPTAIRPIISPDTQARPKAMPSIEPAPSVQNSPPSRSIQINNSPKRPLPREESDNESNRPRKLARGESPLKGAAGQRILDQQKRNRQHPDMSQSNGQSTTHLMPPTPIPREIGFLLSIIPKSSTYHATKFNPAAMVKLIRETHIPTSVSQLRPPPMQNGAGMQQMTPMPPGQHPGRYPHFPHSSDAAVRSAFSPVQSGVRSHEDMTRSTRRSKLRLTVNHKKPSGRSSTSAGPRQEYADCEVLGLCRPRDTAPGDSAPRALTPPLPRALRRINLLSTVSVHDLNAWVAASR